MTTTQRFVVTHVEDSSGARRLTFAQQGRATYATPEIAEEALAAFSAPGSLDSVLSKTEFPTLRVDAVACWAGHHDPVTFYVEDAPHAP